MIILHPLNIVQFHWHVLFNSGSMKYTRGVPYIKGYTEPRSPPASITGGDRYSRNLKERQGTVVRVCSSCLFDSPVGLDCLTRLDAGAQMLAQSRLGLTPLHVSAVHRIEDVVEGLLDGGANIHLADLNRCGSLHYAATAVHTGIATTLLDQFITGKYGKRPVSCKALGRADAAAGPGNCGIICYGVKQGKFWSGSVSREP